jgi:hypothetical protein
MASTFKSSVAKSVGTSANSVYTVPANTTTTVIGWNLCNTTGNPVTVDLYFTRSATDYYILKGTTVPQGGALVPVGGDQKLVLQAADIVKVVAGAASAIDATVSYLEIT